MFKGIVKDGYDIDGLQFAIEITLGEFLVIDVSGVKDAPFEERRLFAFLYLYGEAPSVLSDADQIEISAFPADDIRIPLAVLIGLDVPNTRLRGQNAVK